MFGLSGMIKAFLDCIYKITDYKQTKIKNIEKIDIIENKKDLEKAGNISEEIIEIALKYISSMAKKDQRILKSLIKKFNKVD